MPLHYKTAERTLPMIVKILEDYINPTFLFHAVIHDKALSELFSGNVIPHCWS
jgi:hypothetical protein